MISAAEIDQRISQVANDTLGVFDFGDWLDSYAWNMHRDSVKDAIDVASKAQLLFAEYDIHGDEMVLKRELIGLVKNVVVSKAIDVPDVRQINLRPYFTNSERWLHQDAYPVAA